MLLIVRQKRLTIYYENSFWRLLDNLFATSVDIYWFSAHIYPFRALCMWVFLLLFFALVSGLSFTRSHVVARLNIVCTFKHCPIVTPRAHGMLAGLIEIFNPYIFRLWDHWMGIIVQISRGLALTSSSICMEFLQFKLEEKRRVTKSCMWFIKKIKLLNPIKQTRYLVTCSVIRKVSTRRRRRWQQRVKSNIRGLYHFSRRSWN